MKSEAKPVIQKTKTVPYYLQEPLKKWLQECREKGIYTDVSQDESIICSPLVVQPKPKFTNEKKLEPHMTEHGLI